MVTSDAVRALDNEICGIGHSAVQGCVCVIRRACLPMLSDATAYKHGIVHSKCMPVPDTKSLRLRAIFTTICGRKCRTTFHKWGCMDGAANDWMYEAFVFFDSHGAMTMQPLMTPTARTHTEQTDFDDGRDISGGNDLDEDFCKMIQ